MTRLTARAVLALALGAVALVLLPASGLARSGGQTRIGASAVLATARTGDFSALAAVPQLGQAHAYDENASGSLLAAEGSTPVASLLGREVPELGWGNISHIVERHWAGTATEGAGKFASGTTGAGLRDMVERTIRYGAESPNARVVGGNVYEYDLGRSIGANMAGDASSVLRVVLGAAGRVITAYPI